jgi:ubiquitin C-terminal hydrolase
MTRVLCAEQITDPNPNTTSQDTLFIVEIGVNTQPKIIFEKGSPSTGQITATTTDAKYYKITSAGQPSKPASNASKPAPVSASKGSAVPVPTPVPVSKGSAVPVPTPGSPAPGSPAPGSPAPGSPGPPAPGPPALAAAQLDASKATTPALAAAAAASVTENKVTAPAPAMAPPAKVCGLVNPSVLCYANSAIQLLLDIPEIPEYFKKLSDDKLNDIKYIEHITDTEYNDLNNKLTAGTTLTDAELAKMYDKVTSSRRDCGKLADFKKTNNTRNIQLLREIFNKIAAESANNTPTNIIDILDTDTDTMAVYYELVKQHSNRITPDANKKEIKYENKFLQDNDKYSQAGAIEFLEEIFFQVFNCVDGENNFTKIIGVTEAAEMKCENGTKYDTAATYTPIVKLSPPNGIETSISLLIEEYTDLQYLDGKSKECKSDGDVTGPQESKKMKFTLQKNPDTKYIIINIPRIFKAADGVTDMRNEHKVEIDNEITIDKVQFRRKGCIFHVGTVEGGHYVYGSYDKAGEPNHVRNDAAIIQYPNDIAPKVFDQDGYLSTLCLYERIEDQTQPTLGGSTKTKKRKHKNKKRKTQHKNRN